jgi:hypothetical protein
MLYTFICQNKDNIYLHFASKLCNNTFILQVIYCGLLI